MPPDDPEEARRDRLHLLGQMAGGIVHDLRQHLNLVVGNADLLLLALEKPDVDRDRLRELTRTIQQAAYDGAETVSRILAFGREQQEEPPQRVDLGDVLAEVTRMTAPKWRDQPHVEGRRIVVVQESTGDTAIVGRPTPLRDALVNLVFNAVDALPNGGTIRMRARRHKGQIELAVSDTGTGMTPEVRERIFEPYFTTKGDQGTGLGLPRVAEIVQEHRGRIEVESTPGRGTTFRLTFSPAPTSTWAETDRRRPDRVSAAVAQGLRVLIVDDEPRIGRMASLMLQSGGHRVTVVLSAEEARALLNDGERFDVVITDLGLGAGMNGWELASHLRVRHPAVRVLVATGWGGVDDRLLHTSGVERVIAKPYTVDVLRAAVEGR